MRLIRIAGSEPQRKGTGIVHLYKFAWLIEVMKPNKRKYDKVIVIYSNCLIVILKDHTLHPLKSIIQVFIVNLRIMELCGKIVVDNIR